VLLSLPSHREVVVDEGNLSVWTEATNGNCLALVRVVSGCLLLVRGVGEGLSEQGQEVVCT
jgi:hypothetical protein